ncbi:MAG: hypothetical protein AAGA29_12350 [Planctomycetota bacterium]
MNHIASFMLCFCLLGCSDVRPTEAIDAADTTPPEVLAAWEELDALWDIEPSKSDPADLIETYVLNDNGDYVLSIAIKSQPTPVTGGGVELDPAHMRKKEAWFLTQMLLHTMAPDVDSYGLFARIECVSEVNGIQVNVSIPLPLNAQEPATIELHDPFDGKTYTAPDTGGVPDTGPDHWCFKVFGCDACEENSVLYSPYDED